MHSTVLPLLEDCLLRGQVELCSVLSAIRSLHISEHSGQSEINVLSLGSTQEIACFIVLSCANNCFATGP